MFDRINPKSGGIFLNTYGHSEVEELVLKMLKSLYGSIHESVNEELVLSKIEACKKLYELAVDEYRINQSAHNYNILISAMVGLQYWNQKKTKLFTLTEEF